MHSSGTLLALRTYRTLAILAGTVLAAAVLSACSRYSPGPIFKTGTLSLSDDILTNTGRRVDIWQCTATRTGWVWVEMGDRNLSEIDSYLLVGRDVGGGNVETIEVDNDSGDGVNAMLNWQATSGTRYIILATTAEGSGRETGDYLLTFGSDAFRDVREVTLSSGPGSQGEHGPPSAARVRAVDAVPRQAP